MQEQEKRARFVQAWRTVFGVDDVRDDDNFFEVGGDSLKGVQLVGALAEQGLKLDMLKIYTQPTVEELIAELEEMDPVELPQELVGGALTGEQLEGYLQDPSVRKAMADFGIRAEDVAGGYAGARPAPEPAPQPASAPGAGAAPAPGAQPFPGAMLYGMPQPPQGLPQQGGYLVPVQLMLYVPAFGPDGAPLQPPQGAVPFPMMSWPAPAAPAGSAPTSANA